MEHALFEQIRSNMEQEQHISVVFSICCNKVSSVSSSIKEENKRIHIKPPTLSVPQNSSEDLT